MYKQQGVSHSAQGSVARLPVPDLYNKTDNLGQADAPKRPSTPTEQEASTWQTVTGITYLLSPRGVFQL